MPFISKENLDQLHSTIEHLTKENNDMLASMKRVEPLQKQLELGLKLVKMNELWDARIRGEAS